MNIDQILSSAQDLKNTATSKRQEIFKLLHPDNPPNPTVGITVSLNTDAVPAEINNGSFNFAFFMDQLSNGEIIMANLKGQQDGGGHPEIEIYRSMDGKNFIPKTILKSPADQALSGGGGGVGYNNRILISYSHTDTIDGSKPQSMHVMYSDDGQNFKDVKLQPTTPAFQPGGAIIKIGEGKLLVPWYGWGAGKWGVYASVSSDNGITWGEQITVVESATLQITEPSIISLNENHIIGIARCENNVIQQFESKDNGRSWILHGDAKAIGSDYKDTGRLSSFVVNGKQIVECVASDKGYKSINAIYGYGDKIITDAYRAWDVNSKIAIAKTEGVYYLSNPSVVHFNAEGLGVAFKRITASSAVLSFFKTPKINV